MNHNIRRLLLLMLSFGLVVSVLLTPTVGFAQAISGNVVGTVMDSTGAAVAGADVTGINTATGISANAKTNNTGQYRFDNLPIGSYRFTVKASRFSHHYRIGRRGIESNRYCQCDLDPGRSIGDGGSLRRSSDH